MELDELTELLMQGEGSEMEMAIRQEGQSAGLERLMYFLQVGYFSRRIYDKFDWEAIERDLSRIMQLLEAKGLDPGHARAHPQLSRPAPRGLPPHDPPARGARAGAPGHARGREADARGPHRQAALRALRRRGRADEGGGGPPGPQDQGRPRDAPAAGGEGAARHAADHPPEPAVRRDPDGGAVPAPAPGEAQAGHALRRVGLGAERLPLHAPARVEPAGLLLPRALLRLRVGDRGGHPGLQHLPGGHRDRLGAQVLARWTITAAPTSATPSTAS